MENDFDQFVIENLFDDYKDYPNNEDVSLVLMTIKNMSDSDNCTEANIWEWDVRHLPYVGKRPPGSIGEMDTFDLVKVVAFFFLSVFSLCGNGVVVFLTVSAFLICVDKNRFHFDTSVTSWPVLQYIASH